MAHKAIALCALLALALPTTASADLNNPEPRDLLPAGPGDDECDTNQVIGVKLGCHDPGRNRWCYIQGTILGMEIYCGYSHSFLGAFDCADDGDDLVECVREAIREIVPPKRQ